jgi:Transposase IS66 family
VQGHCPAALEEEPDPDEGRPAAAGVPHVMIVRTPDERLMFLQAIGSRRKDTIAGVLPGPFTGTLIADGNAGYQHLLSRLADIQQCCAHVVRRCRAVAKLGPGGLQSWAEDVITALRDAYRAVEEARACGPAALGPDVLASLEERYDEAVSFETIHNRLRAWDAGNHPGHALGAWLRDYKEQVFGNALNRNRGRGNRRRIGDVTRAQVQGPETREIAVRLPGPIKGDEGERMPVKGPVRGLAPGRVNARP